jgi:hypothetical protein
MNEKFYDVNFDNQIEKNKEIEEKDQQTILIERLIHCNTDAVNSIFNLQNENQDFYDTLKQSNFSVDDLFKILNLDQKDCEYILIKGEKEYVKYLMAVRNPFLYEKTRDKLFDELALKGQDLREELYSRARIDFNSKYYLNQCQLYSRSLLNWPEIRKKSVSELVYGFEKQIQLIDIQLSDFLKSKVENL